MPQILVYVLGVLGIIATVEGAIEFMNRIFKWGHSPMRWLKKQTIGRLSAWVQSLVQQQMTKQLEAAHASEAAAQAQSSFPIDTTPSIERRLAEMEEALRQSGQRITDQRNELMSKLEEQRRANATLTAQLEAATSEEAKHEKELERLQGTLHRLSRGERSILRPYIEGESYTQAFGPNNGIVNGLVAKSILFLATNTPYVYDPNPYNIQPWAYEYLAEHPELVGIDPLAKLQKLHNEAVRRLDTQLEPRKWREVAEVQADLGHFNLIDAATGLPRPIRNWADLDASMPAADLDLDMPSEDY